MRPERLSLQNNGEEKKRRTIRSLFLVSLAEGTDVLSNVAMSYLWTENPSTMVIAETGTV